ncbi:hypothetical protein RCL1_002729 [Eukaryota sp. TZLM3-RCL]
MCPLDDSFLRDQSFTFGQTSTTSPSRRSSVGTSRAVLNALQTLQDKINHLESERCEYEAEIATLRSKLNDSRVSDFDRSGSFSGSSTEKAELRRQVDFLKSKVTDLETSLHASHISSTDPTSSIIHSSLSEENTYLKQKLQEERRYSRSKLAEFEEAVVGLKERAVELEAAKNAAEKSRKDSETIIQQLQQSLESLVLTNKTLVSKLKAAQTPTSAAKKGRKRKSASKPKSKVTINVPLVTGASKSHSLKVAAQQSRQQTLQESSVQTQVDYSGDLIALQERLMVLSRQMNERLGAGLNVDDLAVEIQEVVRQIKGKQRAQLKSKRDVNSLRTMLRSLQQHVLSSTS